MTSARPLAVSAIVVALVSGCATSQQAKLQEAIRKAAPMPVGEATGELPGIFRDLAQSGGLDPKAVYVAVSRSDGLNAAAAGNHHFILTRGIVATGDRCLLTGVAAHELAHDILKHPDSVAASANAEKIASAMFGMLGNLGVRAYSRSQESDADALAITILRNAGRPEWLLRYSLETLQQRTGGSSGGWFSTHPAIVDRIASQPAVDIADVRRICGATPADPPPWCRRSDDHWDSQNKSCTSNNERPTSEGSPR